GVTGAFNPVSIKAGATSTLTLTASASAPATAATTFTVTASAPSDEELANADVTILAGDFAVAITPAKSSVAPGKSATFSVATSIVAGAPGSITLTVDGLPAGVTGEFDSDVLDAGKKATLTLTAAADAAAGSATFTVLGEDDDGLQHSATAQISVSGNDFSLSMSPASATVSRGGTASFSVSS